MASARRMRPRTNAAPRSAMPIPLTGPSSGSSHAHAHFHGGGGSGASGSRATSTTASRQASDQLSKHKLVDPVVEAFLRDNPSSVSRLELRAFHCAEENAPPHRAYWAHEQFSMPPRGLELRVKMYSGRTRALNAVKNLADAAGSSASAAPGEAGRGASSSSPALASSSSSSATLVGEAFRPTLPEITHGLVQIALAFSMTRDRRRGQRNRWTLTQRLREMGIARLLDLLGLTRKAVVEIVKRDVWAEEAGWTTLLKFALSHRSASHFLGPSGIAGAGGLNAWTTLYLDPSKRPEAGGVSKSGRKKKNNNAARTASASPEDLVAYEVSDSDEDGVLRVKTVPRRSPEKVIKEGPPPDEIMLGLKTDARNRELDELLRPFMHGQFRAEYLQAQAAFDAELERAQTENLDLEFYIFEAAKLEEAFAMPPSLRVKRAQSGNGGKAKDAEVIIIEDSDEDRQRRGVNFDRAGAESEDEGVKIAGRRKTKSASMRGRARQCTPGPSTLHGQGGGGQRRGKGRGRRLSVSVDGIEYYEDEHGYVAPLSTRRAPLAMSGHPSGSTDAVMSILNGFGGSQNQFEQINIADLMSPAASDAEEDGNEVDEIDDYGDDDDEELPDVMQPLRELNPQAGALGAQQQERRRRRSGGSQGDVSGDKLHDAKRHKGGGSGGSMLTVTTTTRDGAVRSQTFYGDTLNIGGTLRMGQGAHPHPPIAGSIGGSGQASGRPRRANAGVAPAAVRADYVTAAPAPAPHAPHGRHQHDGARITKSPYFEQNSGAGARTAHAQSPQQAKRGAAPAASASISDSTSKAVPIAAATASVQRPPSPHKNKKTAEPVIVPGSEDEDEEDEQDDSDEKGNDTEADLELNPEQIAAQAMEFALAERRASKRASGVQYGSGGSSSSAGRR
ncbi:hypothetical protein OC835_004300 [Tilletia horrida]|nr:hypothetical protein OC835_004300 [Tilletia horrida]